MKGLKFTFIPFVYFICSAAVAQNNAIFNGGIADGFAFKSSMQASNNIAGNNVYSGGIADGFAWKSYSQSTGNIVGTNIYSGGIADGFAFKSFSQSFGNIAGPDIYSGGIADGYAFASYGSMGLELPLPVELISFTAEVQNNSTVVTKWETATEINSDYFIVERSADGEIFMPVGSINAAGNSNTIQHYSLTDFHPFLNVSYYRLKQFDINGHATYSNTVAVFVGQPGNLSVNIYPNPVIESSQLILDNNTHLLGGNFSLLDMQGKIVYEKKLSEMPMINDHTFIFQKGLLKPGMYIFQVTNDNINKGIGKMIIQ